MSARSATSTTTRTRTQHRCRDQGETTDGGDLLTARQRQPDRPARRAGRERVACPPNHRPVGMNPRRKEVTTHSAGREGGGSDHAGGAEVRSGAPSARIGGPSVIPP